MDSNVIVMSIGFTLASYSVVGNDVIQTLGTYLSSNKNRPWWVLWLFAGSILVATAISSSISYVRYLALPGFSRSATILFLLSFVSFSLLLQ
ncbi:MAG: hypothetical protein J4G05_00335 [Chlorobi bacterium]|nr:hypothetical protein [Chlorobiota bacterium]